MAKKVEEERLSCVIYVQADRDEAFIRKACSKFGPVKKCYTWVPNESSSRPVPGPSQHFFIEYHSRTSSEHALKSSPKSENTDGSNIEIIGLKERSNVIQAFFEVSGMTPTNHAAQRRQPSGGLSSIDTNTQTLSDKHRETQSTNLNAPSCPSSSKAQLPTVSPRVPSPTTPLNPTTAGNLLAQARGKQGSTTSPKRTNSSADPPTSTAPQRTRYSPLMLAVDRPQLPRSPPPSPTSRRKDTGSATGSLATSKANSKKRRKTSQHRKGNPFVDGAANKSAAEASTLLEKESSVPSLTVSQGAVPTTRISSSSSSKPRPSLPHQSSLLVRKINSTSGSCKTSSVHHAETSHRSLVSNSTATWSQANLGLPDHLLHKLTEIDLHLIIKNAREQDKPSLWLEASGYLMELKQWTQAAAILLDYFFALGEHSSADEPLWAAEMLEICFKQIMTSTNLGPETSSPAIRVHSSQTQDPRVRQPSHPSSSDAPNETMDGRREAHSCRESPRILPGSSPISAQKVERKRKRASDRAAAMKYLTDEISRAGKKIKDLGLKNRNLLMEQESTSLQFEKTDEKLKTCTTRNQELEEQLGALTTQHQELEVKLKAACMQFSIEKQKSENLLIQLREVENRAHSLLSQNRSQEEEMEDLLLQRDEAANMLASQRHAMQEENQRLVHQLQQSKHVVHSLLSQKRQADDAVIQECEKRRKLQEDLNRSGQEVQRLNTQVVRLEEWIGNENQSKQVTSEQLQQCKAETTVHFCRKLAETFLSAAADASKSLTEPHRSG